MDANVISPAAAGISEEVPELHAVIVYNSSWYIYNFRANLIRELLARGCRVSTIAPADDYVARIEELGATHYHWPLSAGGLNPLMEVTSVNLLYRLLRRLHPDYVLSYTIKCNLYAAMVRRILGFKQIANVPGLGKAFQGAGPLNICARLMYRRWLREVETVFFQNNEDLAFCRTSGLVRAESSIRIPGSGVDLHRFAAAGRTSLPGPRRFLMIGRLIPEKGFDLLLSAIRQLPDVFRGRICFQIVGRVEKRDPRSRALETRLLAAHQEGLIEFIPGTDNILPYLHGADVAVLPSTYNEGVPRSLLEALACGLPIITTAWKGCRDTVIEGINGELVIPGNSESLRSAIQRFAEMPYVSLQHMGKASRRLAEQRFDERQVIDEYLFNMGLKQNSYEDRWETRIEASI
ncbi:MAG: glycosyltransferase family 4 protein [Deltaproteobacteria bacterium]|nr:glycosyltransferase family 4 protein [Deltaproteobacteria bacterium]